jgi:subtilisin family serine protease
MDNGDYTLIVGDERIRLRKVGNIRFVTPARDAHPATTAARLARSSRLALDPTYPSDSLVVQGDRHKLEEIRSYRDIRNTRAAFLGPQGPIVLTNDLLVSFQSGASDDDRESLLGNLEGQVIERKARFWKFRVDDPGEDAPLLLANELSEQAMVKYAEPNALQTATFHQAPQGEPRFGNQWTLRNTGQNNGTAGADVAALGAWDITTGSSSIGIVVHDSGVDINHPDLIANIGPGRDFDNNDNDATPEADRDAAHGTACAGVIAAAANGQGVAGIAPNCQIIPLRAAGAHSFEVWADTFDWAAQRGRIISCSWSINPSNTLSEAIRDAVNNDVTVFCATGNDSTPFISYPASMAETIAVGASTNRDVRAAYSQFGDGIDIVAPSSGGTLRVETTDTKGENGRNTANSPDGDYCNANDATGFGGTSSATPLAAGIAGLMLSVNNELAPAEIREILRATADKVDKTNVNYDENGWSSQYGFGRVNAAAAVRRAAALVT